jgi:hypothetical protein
MRLSNDVESKIDIEPIASRFILSIAAKICCDESEVSATIW